MRLNKRPSFSIIMANYNNAKYIEQAIKSVFAQSVSDWELLIVDDCSSDDSVSIIKKYLHDKRIRFYQNEKNLGYISTLKLLLEKADSPIVAIIDSDDVISKDAVEAVLQSYKRDARIGMVYSQYHVCDKNLRPQHLGFSGEIKSGKTNLHLNVAHHFKTFKKEVYQMTSGYDEKMKYAEDIDLNLKIEEVSRLYFIDKPLYFYRVLPKSQTHGFKNLRINRSSTALAKLGAYKRRKRTGIFNLSRVEVSEVLFFGMINALLALRFKLFLNFKLNLFYIYPIFLFDPRFYVLIYKKIRKIKNLKKAKPLLGV